MTRICWEIPMRTVIEANCSEHWTKRAHRHREQQRLIRLYWRQNGVGATLPCQICLTRLAPRFCDSDNLLSAFKWIRDEISECLIPEKRSAYITANGKIQALKGRADDDKRIKWHYFQEKSSMYAIRIEIECGE